MIAKFQKIEEGMNRKLQETMEEFNAQLDERETVSPNPGQGNEDQIEGDEFEETDLARTSHSDQDRGIDPLVANEQQEAPHFSQHGGNSNVREYSGSRGRSIG